MTLAAWLHDLSPFVFRFTDTFGVRWYGLSYVAAFVIGWLILRWLSRRGTCRIPADRAIDAMMIVVLGTIVGGRLGYVLLGYDFRLIHTFTSSPPYWGLLAINQGGMASHGGLIGLTIAAWWISRGFKAPAGQALPELAPAAAETTAPASGRVGVCPTLHVMDTLALMACPGLLLGRIANFINGELLGAVVSPPGKPGPWWTVQFPQELRGWSRPGFADAQSHTPELNGEQRRALWELVEDALGRWGGPGGTALSREQVESALLRPPAEQPYRAWQHGIELVIEHAGQYRGQLEGLLSSRHASQLYQSFAEGAVLGATLWIVAAKARKPGVIAAWFFIAYGALRILTEVWRLPDPQFAEGRPWGLSRGQWFSAAMVGAGVLMLVWAARRAGEKMGGWWAPRSKAA